MLVEPTDVGTVIIPGVGTGAATMTFLFTDVEGSTRMLDALGDAFPPTIEQHRSLLRAAFIRHGGEELGTEGDSFVVVFVSAAGAVAAALDAQLALRAHDWPDQPVHVRMGLHTGEAQTVNGEYYGMAIHLAGRIGAAAYGDQILLSHATAQLARDTLPSGAVLHDLGEHRLKDFPEPTRLLEVGHLGLRRIGIARSSAVLPNNLPPQLTSFVGRRAETREIHKLLETTRLLNVTGAGGSGKTRLALQLATDALEEYRDGAWFVDLAAIADDELVWSALARALGMTDQSAASLDESVMDRMRDRTMLVVLDNCEHVIAGAATVCRAIMAACHGVKLVATSREPLGIEGEMVWALPTLSVPAVDEALELIAASEAVALFRDRADRASPGFVLSEANAAAVADICRRLDGLPLAIELAAARVRTLTPAEIAARLDNRFALLTGGARGGLRRQQTLRAAVEWSHDLLSDEERVLFRRLSVFVNGFELEAAEAIAGSAPLDSFGVLDVLSALVDRSLVIADQHEQRTRYRLLETNREFAREQLAASGEAAELWQRHLDWYAALAEEAEPALDSGRGKVAWVERLVIELPNIHQAMAWAAGGGDRGTGLRLWAYLTELWPEIGAMAEGRDTYARLLGNDPVPSELRHHVAFALGRLVLLDGDFVEAVDVLEPFLDADPAEGPWIGRGLLVVALAYQRLGEPEAKALEVYDSARAAAEMHRDEFTVHDICSHIGRLHFAAGRHDDARRCLDEALSWFRANGIEHLVGSVLGDLAELELDAGNRDSAMALAAEAFTLQVGSGRKIRAAHGRRDYAVFARANGDYPLALQLLGEAADISRGLADVHAEWITLQLMRPMLTDLGRHDDAEFAARALLESVMVQRSPLFRAVALREVLGAGLNRGDLASARAALRELAPIADGLGPWWQEAIVGFDAAKLAFCAGETDVARAGFERAVAIARHENRLGSLPWSLSWLGHSLLLAGDRAAAIHCFTEALDLGGSRYPSPVELLRLLERTAELLVLPMQSESAQILAAAAAARARMRTPLLAFEAAIDASIATARAALGSDFDAAWATGAEMALDDVPAFALAALARL
jgi:predicted ATPase/class 3 adenylate cyclase